MKYWVLFFSLFLLIGCTQDIPNHLDVEESEVPVTEISETPLPTLTQTMTSTVTHTQIPTETSTTTLTNTKEPVLTTKPTISFYTTEFGELPESISVEENQLIFSDWNFTVQFEDGQWHLLPELILFKEGFEIFGFLHNEGYQDEDGKYWRPCVSFHLYDVPEDLDLIIFSTTLRVENYESFPEIDWMFGFEGSEIELDYPALGYYGHLPGRDDYSVYVIHAIHEGVGVQISFEIVDSVLDQAIEDFYPIMKSIQFIEVE